MNSSSRLRSVITGEAIIVPRSDHVPELMNANRSAVAGIAATAQAVSRQTPLEPL